MTWRILMIDAEGQKYTSSALATEAEALEFTKAVTVDGKMTVLRIENEHGQTLPFEPATEIVKTMDAEIEEQENRPKPSSRASYLGRRLNSKF